MTDWVHKFGLERGNYFGFGLSKERNVGLSN